MAIHTFPQKTDRIRLLVLVPIITTFFLTLGMIVFSINAFYTDQLHQKNHDITLRVQRNFNQQIIHSTADISGLLQIIEKDSDLRAAWLKKDRQSLAAATQEIYAQINKRFNITHFYFHTLEGKNFLRAHRPGRFGDIINRKTLLSSRRSGQLSAGLEVGTFGQFVLRVVQPWIIDGELAGYLELGMGIDHITHDLKQITGADIITLIDKQLIDRSDWQKAFGNKFKWQRLDKWVIASSTFSNIPASFDLQPHPAADHREAPHSSYGGRYETSSFPLSDFSNTEVGYMLVIQDISTDTKQLNGLLLKTSIIGLIAIILLSIAYFIYLGKIERRLLQTHRSLHQKIAEHEKTEIKLRISRDELAAINRELESYSYSIAHDLRAPLRSVTSFSQIVLADAKDRLDQEDIHNLNRVISASKRMAELIDDILQLSRITRDELSLQTVDLSKIAERIKYQLSSADPDRHVEWDIQSEMFTKADPHLIERAMENLLGNAWKYTGYTANAKISFGTINKNNETVYFVRDNGAGFDMAYAHKLFATFQRLHNPREFTGSGVGLAIVLRVIQRHHGRIWGEGEVGKGATFYFTLPDISAS